jgi:hypothetical protein
MRDRTGARPSPRSPGFNQHNAAGKLGKLRLSLCIVPALLEFNVGCGVAGAYRVQGGRDTNQDK